MFLSELINSEFKTIILKNIPTLVINIVRHRFDFIIKILVFGTKTLRIVINRDLINMYKLKFDQEEDTANSFRLLTIKAVYDKLKEIRKAIQNNLLNNQKLDYQLHL